MKVFLSNGHMFRRNSNWHLGFCKTLLHPFTSFHILLHSNSSVKNVFPGTYRVSYSRITRVITRHVLKNLLNSIYRGKFSPARKFYFVLNLVKWSLRLSIVAYFKYNHYHSFSIYFCLSYPLNLINPLHETKD